MESGCLIEKPRSAFVYVFQEAVGSGVELGQMSEQLGETVGTGLVLEFKARYAPPPAKINIKIAIINNSNFPEKKDLWGVIISGCTGEAGGV